MKLTLKTAKPRNPFVAASLRRVAGAHGPGGGARRQQARRALHRELADGADRRGDRPPKPSP